MAQFIFIAATTRPAGTAVKLPRESLAAIAGKPLLRERKVQIRHAIRAFISISIMVALTAVLLQVPILWTSSVG